MLYEDSRAKADTLHKGIESLDCKMLVICSDMPGKLSELLKNQGHRLVRLKKEAEQNSELAPM